MYSSDYIYNILKRGISIVTFNKIDGSVRTMRCTLNDDYLPDQYRGKTMVTEDIQTMRVFDVDVGQWRSFRIESVTSVQE